jgi:chromosome segregation ATPase
MTYAHGGKKQAFRKAHSAEIEQYEAAVDRLREAEKQLGHKPPPMKELKAQRVQLENKRDTLETAYQEVRSESKDLTAARAAAESQLGIHRDIPQKRQEKQQEKQTYTPDHEHGKMDLRAELQQCTSEAERPPEAQSVRQDKAWGLSHDEPER